MDAAARLFGQRGVDVPLDEIAVAANVGSATLHRHFRGRVELVHAVLDTRADRLATRSDELMTSSATTQIALREWLLELIEFTTSFRGLAVLLADHDADTTLEDRHRALTVACARLLTAAQADGHIRPTIIAGDLLKLAHGIAVAAAGSPAAAADMLDLLADGLRTPTARCGALDAPTIGLPVTSVTLRHKVDDLHAAIPFYEQLTGETADLFEFSGLQLAAVGPFLLFSGSEAIAARFEGVAATLVVRDLLQIVASAKSAGASEISPAQPTPNGLRAVLRHPDGAVFEYVGSADIQAQ
ncbi:TetR family transcriptional regulator [Nocardia sp. NPDC101769]|uniref:SbtR family transcriptional regulator n=1 Tax=Nocardia sp. NPDC101769 TaxID=3364333 RepID=UPI00380FF489